MPEQQQEKRPDHEQYEMLCSLAAGGLLEGEEFADFQIHLKSCSECRSDYEELSVLVTRELPQAQRTFQQKLAAMKAKPLDNSRQRFLRRAQAEGVVFSNDIGSPPDRVLGTSVVSRFWFLLPR